MSLLEALGLRPGKTARVPPLDRSSVAVLLARVLYYARRVAEEAQRHERERTLALWGRRLGEAVAALDAALAKRRKA